MRLYRSSRFYTIKLNSFILFVIIIITASTFQPLKVYGRFADDPFIILTKGWSNPGDSNLVISKKLPPKFTYSIGFGTTYSFGKLEDKERIQMLNGDISINPKWSTEWPVSSSETELLPIENAIRKVSFMISVEYYLKNNFYVATGLESGGRYYQIEENIYEVPNLKVITNRGYCVFSLPIYVKHDTKILNAFTFRQVAGLVANLSSSETSNEYYVVNERYAFFPTAAIGFELGVKSKKDNHIFSFDILWQQGFYNFLDEYIIPISPILTENSSNSPASPEKSSYQVKSNGSHLRVGIRFYFNKSTFIRSHKPSN